jgi:hypothetical protein
MDRRRFIAMTSGLTLAPAVGAAASALDKSYLVPRVVWTGSAAAGLDLDLKRRAVQIAVCAARKCLANFESAFEDERPRRAIEAAENWRKNPTDENRWLAAEAETPVWRNLHLWQGNGAAYNAAYAAGDAARAARGGEKKALESAMDAIYSEFRSNGGRELPADDYRSQLSYLLMHLVLCDVVPKRLRL